MNLNIHPIFVHFPIALLTIYSLMELLRFKKLLSQPYWFYVKAVFVIIGSITTATALLTGSLAEDTVNRSDVNLHALIDVHSNWAVATTIIFALLAVCYLVAWVEREFNPIAANSNLRMGWNFLLKVKHYILESPAVIILAFIGLVTVTITGALGGAVAYGHNIDPIVNFVYHLFFK